MIDVSRLKSQLLISGLQKKDPPLFQVIDQLIRLVGDSLNISSDLADLVATPTPIPTPKPIQSSILVDPEYDEPIFITPISNPNSVVLLNNVNNKGFLALNSDATGSLIFKDSLLRQMIRYTTGNFWNVSGTVFFMGPGSTLNNALIQGFSGALDKLGFLAKNFAFASEFSNLVAAAIARVAIWNDFGIADQIAFMITGNRAQTNDLVRIYQGDIQPAQGNLLFSFTPKGILSIGAVAAYPTNGTLGLVFGDGTALSAMGANTAGLYADDVSGTVRMFGIDEANVTGALAMAAGPLTSGRVALIGTSGLLTDDSDLTFATDTLTATHINQETYHRDGIHHSHIGYVSGTGTAGVDNTAQTVVTIPVDANALIQNGDHLRIRCYWSGDSGGVITGSILFGPAGSEVLLAHTTDVGAATLQLIEGWLMYLDNTHANLIEDEGGGLGPLSAVNVAGFTWNAAQQIIITQNAVVGNHIIVYAVLIDIFPKGVN